MGIVDYCHSLELLMLQTFERRFTSSYNSTIRLYQEANCTNLNSSQMQVDESTAGLEALYRTRLFYLWAIAGPTILLLGTVGNLLAVVILRHLPLRQYATSKYLCFLAISDLVALYTGFLRYWIRFGIHPTDELEIRNSAVWFCKVHIYLTFTTIQLSAWILVLVALERFISTWFPIQATRASGGQKTARLFVLILIVTLLSNCHWFFSLGSEESQDQTCGLFSSDLSVAIYHVHLYFHLTMYALIPGCLIIVFNLLIVVQILRANALRNETLQPAHRSSFASLTVMLLVISVFFIVTATPLSLYQLVTKGETKMERVTEIRKRHYFDPETAEEYQLALVEVRRTELERSILLIILYLNNATNFIWYCISGREFRKIVRKTYDAYRRKSACSKQRKSHPHFVPPRVFRQPLFIQVSGAQRVGFGVHSMPATPAQVQLIIRCPDDNDENTPVELVECPAYRQAHSENIL